MMRDLFETELRKVQICEGAMLFKGAAIQYEKELLLAVNAITQSSPFRNMITPGGFKMSVGMTACGDVGWTTDKKGYRYVKTDPLNGQPWPKMPVLFKMIGDQYAQEAGFEQAEPDSSIINNYLPGSKLSLHQDKDEINFNNPVISISLGLTARFMFGGEKRNDPIKRFSLEHGDVFVFGGPARLNYHGVAPIKQGEHPLVGNRRICITLRKAL